MFRCPRYVSLRLQFGRQLEDFMKKYREAHNTSGFASQPLSPNVTGLGGSLGGTLGIGNLVKLPTGPPLVGTSSSSPGGGARGGVGGLTGLEKSRELFNLKDGGAKDEGPTSQQYADHGGALKKDKKYLTKETLLNLETMTCELCHEKLKEERDFFSHSNFGGHRLGMCVFSILMEGYKNRSVKSVVDEWAESSLYYANYFVVRDLVSTDIEVCCKKLRQTLSFLKSQGVLKSSLNMTKGHSFEFDQVEWVGDLALPPLLHEVIAAIFDVETTSSVYPMLGPVMGVLAGNPHLEASYEYMKLGEVVDTGTVAVQGKTKSDVVEALLGELEMFLWACQVDVSCARVTFPPSPHVQSLLALATHCRYVIVVMIVLCFFHPAVSRVVPILSRVLLQENRHVLPRDPGRVLPRARPQPPAQHSRRTVVKLKPHAIHWPERSLSPFPRKPLVPRGHRLRSVRLDPLGSMESPESSIPSQLFPAVLPTPDPHYKPILTPEIARLVEERDRELLEARRKAEAEAAEKKRSEEEKTAQLVERYS